MSIVGEGSGNVAYERPGGLIVRKSKEADLEKRARLVRHEAALLDVVSSCRPPDTPQPIDVDERAGAITYRKIGGTPLLEVAVFSASTVIEALAPFLSRLHAITVERVRDLVEVEEDTVEHWHEYARRKYPNVEGDIPSGYRPAITRFLDSPPPTMHSVGRLCHNDLGVEHILVEADAGRVTGIIDWSDAAITDPARDFALILRDLGPATLDSVLERYATSEDKAEICARAAYYARCSAFDDIEYGLGTGRRQYTDKGLATLRWLFPG